jgi:hypothetical protein
MGTLKKNPTINWHKKRPVKHVDHLSAHSVGSFLLCGLSWRLGHIDQLTLIEPMPSYFAFGGAIHHGLEPYWKGGEANFKKGWMTWKDKKVNYFGSSWLAHYRMGQAMTATVIEKTQGKFDPKQTKTEVNINIDLGFVTLNGRKDVTTIAHNMPIMIGGKYENIDGPLTWDLKTSGQLYASESIDRSQQLKTYAIPDPKHKQPQGVHAYLVVTKGLHPTVQMIGKRFTREEVKGQIERIRWVSDEIHRGIFVQNQGEHCHNCPFRKLCYEEQNWQTSYEVGTRK